MRAKRDAISKMTLMTDIFFEAFAEDVNAIQEMLRVILKDELTVLNVIPQKQIRNLFGRSVRLDAVCKLSDDRIVEIETQNEDNDDHVKRAFFNSAQIMVKTHKPERNLKSCHMQLSSTFQDSIRLAMVY